VRPAELALAEARPIRRRAFLVPLTTLLNDTLLNDPSRDRSRVQVSMERVSPELPRNYKGLWQDWTGSLRGREPGTSSDSYIITY
jgi:hypothetical protein